MIAQTVLLGFLALATAAKIESSLPRLKLPWGIWQATTHENDGQIYVFRNVRFGASPERFSRPVFPDQKNNTIQNITQDISCIQVNPLGLPPPPGGKSPLGDPEHIDESQCEDCLFLDIYAPVSAFQSSSTLLPVVVWIYGGAYAYGSKNPHGPINSGQSILNASNYQTIFITGNYRVGAFGWLAGNYMQRGGQPNAGLYDQALLLEWVKDYVYQVKGDNTRVSAWGESAGAGSILHHLIREDGTHNPLFRTFVVQSPAFQWAWDNYPDGELDTIYKTFSDFAGCGSEYNISCLREADLEKLKHANQMLFDSAREKGVFPVGPAVDGNWVRGLPKVAFSQRNFWKGIDAAIISHCANESFSFTPDINCEEQFDEYICAFLPGPDQEPLRHKIKEQYNCRDKFQGNFRDCLAAVIQDSAFTCNTRDLFESNPRGSYMMKYSFPWAAVAFHAVDLIPLFRNNIQEVEALLESLNVPRGIAKIYASALGDTIPKTYQNYFASLAIFGDPNGDPNEDTSRKYLKWLVANGTADELTNVMEVVRDFDYITDDQNAKSTCSLWTEIANELKSQEMNIGGEQMVGPQSDVEEL